MTSSIEGLEHALEDAGEPALRELESAITEALDAHGRALRLTSVERLKSRVFRVRVAVADEVRSLVVKRLEPQAARRHELALRRWLPEAGLAGIAPALLAVGAQRGGDWVWHVYEDLGPWMLDARQPDRDRVAAAVRAIAGVHSYFAGHPVLAECRREGQDLGSACFATNVCDAIRGLEGLRPPYLDLTRTEAELRDRLLSRLRRLRDETAERTEALERFGGPETFLHGDLWTINTFVEPVADGHRVRFIDWDRCGVGHAAYDLSAFLMRFAPVERRWILERYRESLNGRSWRMPEPGVLNRLFETAEFGRYANRAIWPAVALRRERAPWGFGELATVDAWFEEFLPVIAEPAR